MQKIFDQKDKADCYDNPIEEIAKRERNQEKSSKSRSFQDIETNIPLSFVTETGDSSRFAIHSNSLHFLGWCPERNLVGKGKKEEEYQSRKYLIETVVIAYVDRPNQRLHRIYDRLTSYREHSNKGTVAVARKLLKVKKSSLQLSYVDIPWEIHDTRQKEL